MEQLLKSSIEKIKDDECKKTLMKILKIIEETIIVKLEEKEISIKDWLSESQTLVKMKNAVYLADCLNELENAEFFGTKKDVILSSILVKPFITALSKKAEKDTIQNYLFHMKEFNGAEIVFLDEIITSAGGSKKENLSIWFITMVYYLAGHEKLIFNVKDNVSKELIENVTEKFQGKGVLMSEEEAVLKYRKLFIDTCELIKDLKIKKLTIKSIEKLNEKFFIEEPSSTRKYHPDYSSGVGGTARHTLANVFFINIIQNSKYGKCSSLEKDLCVAACLLHDGAKRGINMDEKHTCFDHPLLVRKLFEMKELEEMECVEEWDKINVLISTHMGQWNEDKNPREEERKEPLPKISNRLQFLVHMADYLGSRKNIMVDIFDELPQDSVDLLIKNFKDGIEKKDEKASDAQVKYIKQLIKEIEKENPVLYEEKYGEKKLSYLTKKRASILISEMKKLVDDFKSKKQMTI